ncbi:MAG TPA: hypothetical protein DEH78_19115, partial [Solibacterales bacterium]|nr:hypothetical protein [Bryobacterales bacterium]
MAQPPLRFGVMCKAEGLPAFGRRCIAGITEGGLAEPALLIVDEAVEAPSSLGAKLRKSIRLDGNLWHLQSKLFPPSRIESYRREPLETCLPGLPRMVCTPHRKGKWSQYFSEDDLARIRTFELDFILKFAFGIIRGGILEAARFGVWSFHHDDEEKYRGGPPAFWEIVAGDPVTGALLQRLTDRLDGGVVLKKCFVATDPLSYRANLERIHSCSWHMVRWACLDLRNGRTEAFHAPPSRTTAPIYRAPNDWQMLRFWTRLAANWVRYKLQNQRVEEWNVGFVNAPQAAFLAESAPPIEWSAYREEGQMIADPFLLPSAESPRILAEELNHYAERGRIVEVRRSAADSGFDTLAPVIDAPFHMSYPFAFAHEGQIFAIPETAERRSVCLYKLEAGAWRREAVLMEELDAVDVTVHYDGRTWWLFHASLNGCGPWSLFVWHAPALFGPWTPHLANPVKTDVSSSRPAGNLFVHEGKLYRPAQDCRRSYGAALCIHRVDELSPLAYRETLVRRVFPDPNGPYPDGLHTLSGFGPWSVVDGKRHTWPVGVIARRFGVKKLGLAAPEFR